MEHKKLIWFFLVFFLSYSTLVVASLNDNFSDGDYTNNPPWTVGSGTWSAANGSLTSSSNGAYIWLLPDFNHATVFDLSFDFNNTSTLNTGNLVFLSDRNTAGVGNQYYIYPFANGLNPGSIELRKVIAGVDTALITKLGILSANTNYTIRVTRAADGNIDLFVNGSSQGTVINTQLVDGNYFSLGTDSGGVKTLSYDNIYFSNISLIIDVNSPTNQTYSNRLVNFIYRIYDENSARCSSFDLDVNSIVGLDNNLLVRHTGINSSAIDSNYLVLNSEGIHQVTFSGACDTNKAQKISLIRTFTLDLNAPIIYLFDNNINSGWDTNAKVDIRLGCTDTGSTLNYFVSRNGSTLLDSNIAKDTNRTINAIALNGINDLNVICTDSFGRKSKDFNRSTTYINYFQLIDEQTGGAFDLTNVLYLTAKTYNSKQSFDFKANATTTEYFISGSSDTVRFDLNYVGGIRVFREFNTIVLGDNNTVRVCAAKIQDFFEVILFSNSSTPGWVKNDFADCYSLADYTKYGLQGGLTTTAYLINTPYTLYSIDTLHKTSSVLTRLDGSKVATVNLDLLAFNLTSFRTSIQDDYVVAIRAPDSNILQIAYTNYKFENTSVTLNIYKNGSLVSSTTNTATPNSLTVNFDLTNQFDSNVYKIEVIKTLENGSHETITQYVGQESGNGLLQPQFAVFAAIAILLAGLTLTATRFTLSWFGIFIAIIALLFLGDTLFSLWYVQFFAFITIFIAIFIGIVWSKRGFEVG